MVEMASASSAVALCLVLTLCSCEQQKPTVSPVIVIPKIKIPSKKQKIPVKEQIKNIQSRVDALEEYLQNNINR